MPKNERVMSEAKYSNLISPYQLLTQSQSRTPRTYMVVLQGITGAHTFPAIEYCFTQTTAHPLKALGQAVVQFFEYHPAGSIKDVKVYKH